MRPPRAIRTPTQSGHAMLELALSAGVMIACLAGTYQFGYTFYVYNQLVTAVGNGARYAAQRTYRTGAATDVDKGRLAIRNMVVYGDSVPLPDAPPVVPRLSPDQVRVEWVPGPDGRPQAVRVGIREYVIDAMFGKFDLANRPDVEFPFVGRFAPEESEP